MPDDPRAYRYDLYPQAGANSAPNGLFLAIDLSQVPDQAAKVDISLHGLSSESIKFATSFLRTPTLQQIAIQRQRLCPVSGKPLGSMGPPPNVKIEEQEIFVCCKSCIPAVHEQPDEYLDKVAALHEAASQPLNR